MNKCEIEKQFKPTNNLIRPADSNSSGSMTDKEIKPSTKEVDLNIQRFKVVSIEGNIGSGKSTLLENLKNNYKNDSKVVFLKEPVDEWEKITDRQGNTMLQKFYGDQKSYSFSFQMMAYISRLAEFKKAVKKNPQAKIFITERSLDTDKYVFAQMLFDDNKIEDVNFQIYTRWFDTFSEEFNINKFVYVKAEPEICSERILKRSRSGENGIPLDYLKNCDKYHNNMMFERISAPCLTLDGNMNIYENSEIVKKWIDQIDKFIYE
jgi:deoxyadenosine/deoxycytidine kinase